jgi:hypothetical protein
MNDESLSSSSSLKPTSTGEPALSSSKELQHVTGLSKGRAWVFGDNINTDIIIPFRFKSRTNDPYEMAKYAMYGFDPDFHKKISKDDIIVAGRIPRMLDRIKSRQVGKLQIVDRTKN